jgi:hypothetical protein
MTGDAQVGDRPSEDRRLLLDEDGAGVWRGAWPMVDALLRQDLVRRIEVARAEELDVQASGPVLHLIEGQVDASISGHVALSFARRSRP